MGKNRKMKIAKLKPHPKNEEIYGYDEDVSDLVEKIKRSGQVHTLTVNSDGVILAGHRRYKACIELGIDEVDVEIIDFNDPEEEIQYIIDNNATREKTNEQKGREALALKEVISELAKKRKLNTLKQNQSLDMPNSAQRQEQSSKMPNLAQREDDDINHGKTRDIVASKLNYRSGQEVDRTTNTIEIMDKLDKEGRHEDAELIRGVLNNRNASAAETLAKNIDNVVIPEEEKKAVQSGAKSPNAYIKKKNKKLIETEHREVTSEQDELDDLKKNQRKKVAQKLKDARESGIESEAHKSAKAEYHDLENENNVKKSMLIQIKQHYNDFLLAFQRDIEWLCDMEFYQNNDEIITREAHSKLKNCLEKFKSINDMMQQISIDDFGNITLNK
jgi:ParB family chromosome partitioning protein